MQVFTFNVQFDLVLALNHLLDTPGTQFINVKVKPVLDAVFHFSSLHPTRYAKFRLAR
jgi:hypothetical protein